jgi:transposase
MPVVTGHLTTRLLESPTKATAQSGRSTTARLQQAFLAHLHAIARAYPATLGKPVLLPLDKAPWHKATGVAQGLAAHPQFQVDRLPSSSPQLHLLERLWRVLRRRATHNRLFPPRTELRTALRASFGSFSKMRHKVLSLIHSPRKRKEAKLTDA